MSYNELLFPKKKKFFFVFPIDFFAIFTPLKMENNNV